MKRFLSPIPYYKCVAGFCEHLCTYIYICIYKCPARNVWIYNTGSSLMDETVLGTLTILMLAILMLLYILYIKTHDSESRGQEKPATTE